MSQGGELKVSCRISYIQHANMCRLQERTLLSSEDTVLGLMLLKTYTFNTRQRKHGSKVHFKFKDYTEIAQT